MVRKPQQQPERRAEDEVAEAGYESFPASDPPAYNMPGRPDSESHDDAPATTAEMRGRMPSRRTMGKSSAEDPAVAPFDTDDEAAGRPAQASAIEQAMARQNVRVGPGHASGAPTGAASRGGRPVLIGIVVLAVVLVAWLILA